MNGTGSALPGTDGYPLAEFPWEPWRLVSPVRELTAAQAGEYVAWLAEAEAGRVAVIRRLLAQIGAPAGEGPGEPVDLLGVGRRVQRWLARVGGPLVARGFVSHTPEARLGEAGEANRPELGHFWPEASHFLLSLTHDLAFLVADRARAARPQVRWRVGYDAGFNLGQHGFFATIDPEPLAVDLVWEVKDFLVQSFTVWRGERGRELGRWYEGTLERCCRRAVEGAAPPSKEEEFPDAWYRGRPRYELKRPRRGDPEPPAELVEAVAAFRRAGWFEGSKLSDPDLAKSARAAWRRFERDDLPAWDGQAAWQLLLLDVARTWSEDAEVNAGPGDGLHGMMLGGIAEILATGRTVADAEEDWTASPGDVWLTFHWRRTMRRLFLPSPGGYLSPALVTGMNALLAEEEPRLWFFDHGPPLAIVTRATVAERDALERLTGLRLDAAPPRWWTNEAPLPRPEYPPPAPGEPATAREAFKRLMRELIAPAMNELGLRGRAGTFTLRRGGCEGVAWAVNSKVRGEDRIDFEFDLEASRDGAGYWLASMHMPMPREAYGWSVRPGQPLKPVAEEVLRVFRACQLPALEAALESPGYPPDPDARWPRTFPLSGGSSGSDPGPMPDLTAITLTRAHHDNDGVFARLASSDPGEREGAVQTICEYCAGDPRSVPALINRLEHEPAPRTRQFAALGLLRFSDRPEAYRALQEAAAQDEDLHVRIQARYVLRLAGGNGRSRP